MGSRPALTEGWAENALEKGCQCPPPCETIEKPPLDPNPPYGEKGDFRKVTVTLPPTIYERLVGESTRRKIAGKPNQLLSCLLREAVVIYLNGIEP